MPPKNEAIKIYANKSGAYPVDPYAAQIIGEDGGTAFVRVAMSLCRNLGLTLTCDKTAGEVGKQIAGASVAAIAAFVISGFWLHFSRIKRKLPRRQNQI